MDALDLITTETVAVWQAQVESILEQLETAAKRIRELAQENDRLCSDDGSTRRSG
jgi:hypothetical protein